MQYLITLRDNIKDELLDKLGDDFGVRTFWSNELVEFIDYIDENQPRLSKAPHIYVVCPSVSTIERFGLPTDVKDSVTVWIWVVSRDNREEERQFWQADEVSILTRAYLSDKQFSTDFTNKNSIEDWQITQEEETDEMTIYSVVGDLELHVDEQKVIDTYESS